MASIVERLRAQYGLKADADVGVRPALAEIKETSPGNITAVANTAAIDLVDEVVVPEGAERDAKGQPVYFGKARAIFYNHDYGAPPIGTFRNARLTPAGWVCQFAMSRATQFARDIGALIGEGAINGVSIGFIRLAGGQPTDDEVARYGMAAYITRTWRWLELSVTPQPCNPEAWITSAKSVADGPFAEKVRKAMERRVIHEDTARMMGVPARKKIIVLGVRTP